MKATKPQLRPRRRWSSSRGHMILTLARGPKRPNSFFKISSFRSGARLPAAWLPGQSTHQQQLLQDSLIKSGVRLPAACHSLCLNKCFIQDLGE